MRPRDRVKPEGRLDPRPEDLLKPQVFRPVRGVRPEIRRSNATHTADAISNNLQLSNVFGMIDGELNLYKSI